MKANHIIIIVLLALITSSFFIWYSIKKTKTPRSILEKVIVGTNAEYPPFTFLEGEEIVGFDIDLITMIFKRLKIKMEVKDMGYTVLLPAMQLGKIDVIAAGITATPERAQQVIFTKPYLKDDPLLVVSLTKNPPIKSLEDLHGKSVIVDEGYTSDMYMSKFENIDIQRTPSPLQGFLVLKTERADAYVIAKSSAQLFLRKYGKETFNIFEIEDEKSKESYSLVVSKKYLQLAEKIQKELNEMLSDGTVQKLRAKWKLLW